MGQVSLLRPNRRTRGRYWRKKRNCWGKNMRVAVLYPPSPGSRAHEMLMSSAAREEVCYSHNGAAREHIQ